MKRTFGILLIIMIIIAAFPCKALAVNTEDILNKIVASDGSSSDFFGYAVASSGTKVVIGAWGDNVFGSYSGSAYVYDLSSGVLADILASEIKLTPSDGAYNDRYGFGVAISGDTVVIGAKLDDDRGTDSGSVYIYNLSNGTGSAADVRASQIKLTPNDGVTNGFIGETVSISGDTLVVGAHGDDDRGTASGSVYIYNMSDISSASAILATQKKITASDGEAVDCFGCYVDVSDNMLVVGAYGDDDRGSGAGAAYVYNLANGSGSASDIMASERKLLASDGATGDYFGIAVAISGNNVVIGAYGDKDYGTMSGSAYVYDLSNGSGSASDVRASQIKLTAYDGAEFDAYGYCVAVSGDLVVIGSCYDDDKGANSGSIYVYDLTAANVMDSVIKLTASDGAMGDNFGCAVDFFGDKMIIGAQGDSDKGYSSGSAYFQSAKELMGTTISYNDNGGTGGQSATKKATFESDMPTPITLPTRTGYVFNGYYDASSGGTQYYTSSGASARTWDIEEAAAATLYAQWTALEATISYSDNGGSGGQSAETTAVYDSDMATPITLPTRTGYDFAGYYDAASGGTQYYTSEGASARTWDKEDETATLYAQWTAYVYTVVFDGNSNTGGSTSDQAFNYDEQKTLTPNGFTKTGYSFSGWATSATGAVVYSDTETVKNLSDVDGDTVTLYAKWTQDIYTVDYDANGGSGSIASQTGVYGDVITLNDGANFTKANAVLEEWSLGSLGGLYTLIGSATAVAQWAADTDGDGVSDDDESDAGTDPNDEDDVPQSGSIVGTIVDEADVPVSGMTVLLNSTPRTTTTNARGQFVFTGVSFSSHTLTLRQGGADVASYHLSFTTGSPSSSIIIDDGAASASSGQVSTVVVSNSISLRLNIQLNGAGYWQLTDVNLTDRLMVANPETGEAPTWYEKLFNWLRGK